MQDHQTLHASTTWDGAVSRTIFGSLWHPLSYIVFKIKLLKGVLCTSLVLLLFCILALNCVWKNN